MDVDIREKNDSDTEILEEINSAAWRAVYPNEEYGISLRDVEIRLENRKKQPSPKREGVCKTYVAEVSGQVLGYCVGCVREQVNQVRSLYLLAEYQRKGIGKKLFEHVSKHFFDPNKDIVVNVAVYNTQAIEAYKKWGFVDTGKRFEDERFRFESGAVIPEMELAMQRRKSSGQ